VAIVLVSVAVAVAIETWILAPHSPRDWWPDYAAALALYSAGTGAVGLLLAAAPVVALRRRPAVATATAIAVVALVKFTFWYKLWGVPLVMSALALGAVATGVGFAWALHSAAGSPPTRGERDQGEP
jgi:hypothetical protein